MFCIKNFICAAAVSLAFTTCARAQTLGDERIVIETPYGNMTIGLYKETPLHRSNFLKLVKEGFYDSTLFHRVINQFMIQGGDPLSKHAAPGDSLGHGDVGYTVPAEISQNLIHKKGTLCAARESDDINPSFASSATQFYLVMGKQRTMQDLVKYEDRINNAHRKNSARRVESSPGGKLLLSQIQRLNAEGKNDSAAIVKSQLENTIDKEHHKTPLYHFDQRQVHTYTTTGGTPHLDGTYTVFGEITEGLEIIDKIAGVKTDARDRPLNDVRIRMRLQQGD